MSLDIHFFHEHFDMIIPLCVVYNKYYHIILSYNRLPTRIPKYNVVDESCGGWLVFLILLLFNLLLSLRIPSADARRPRAVVDLCFYAAY